MIANSEYEDGGIQPLKTSMKDFNQHAKVAVPPAPSKKTNEFDFTNKEILYYRNLKRYYKTNPESIKTMLDIVNGRSKISLRILDWFATRHSKKYHVKYELNDDKIATDEYNFENSFVVHLDYKAQLKTYTKKYFDPFKRKKKFQFNCGGETFVTTIGQLNFFRWAISKKVINNVDENYDQIVKSMNNANKESKKKKAKKVKEVTKTIKVKGGKSIKVLAKKRITKNTASIVLSFE